MSTNERELEELEQVSSFMIILHFSLSYYDDKNDENDNNDFEHKPRPVV